MRSTFQLADVIALVTDTAYFDLHNDFDFVGYEYRPTERRARFDWVRSDGDWVPEGLPARLAMVFDGVSNLAARRRDDEMPFTEDDCLSCISFLPSEFAEEFGAVMQGFRSEDEHISLSFQSGSHVKVWAESVRHEEGA
jgi:hypothetical protein